MSRVFNKLLRNRLTLPLTPFYRAYPYTSGIAIDSADARGCVDLSLGFFCNRIPKAANSTIVTTLARLKFDKEIPSRQAKKLFLTPSLLNTEEVQRFNQLFRFVFVRNPFSRTLSAYLDKVERRALKNNQQTSFNKFLLDLDRSSLHSNAHWAPQSDLLLIPLQQFDFVGHVESLQTDLSTVKNRLLNSQLDEPIKSVLSNATNASSKLESYYNDEAVELVRKLYHKDFELFGYPLDIPT